MRNRMRQYCGGNLLTMSYIKTALQLIVEAEADWTLENRCRVCSLSARGLRLGKWIRRGSRT